MINPTTQPESETGHANQPAEHPQATILIVSPLDPSRKYLAAALAEEGYRVALVDELVDALEEIDHQDVQRVLLDKRLGSIYKEIDEYSSIEIELFDSALDLLQEKENEGQIDGTVGSECLELIASVLAAKQIDSSKCRLQIGPMVNRIGRRLGLSADEQMLAVGVGYLQDLVYLHNPSETIRDRERAVFELMIVANGSRCLPPEVLTIVRLLFRPLTSINYTQQEIIASAVAVADFYYRSIEMCDDDIELSFDLIQNQIETQRGKMFVPGAVDALLAEISPLYLNKVSADDHSVALVYSESSALIGAIEPSFRTQGFGIRGVNNLSALAESFAADKPSALVLLFTCAYHRAVKEVENVIAAGVPIHQLPTFVVLADQNPFDISAILDLGVTDVVNSVYSVNTLLLKIRRALEAKERESRQRLAVLQDMGTHGSLSDMNIIDLLQAMGPTAKTFRISVSAHGEQLTVYLSKNQLIYAECDDKLGEEAIFESINWERGIWSVDPINEEEVPAPNIHRSIDSILIQGCCKVDQEHKDDPQINL